MVGSEFFHLKKSVIFQSSKFASCSAMLFRVYKCSFLSRLKPDVAELLDTPHLPEGDALGPSAG